MLDAAVVVGEAGCPVVRVTRCLPDHHKGGMICVRGSAGDRGCLAVDRRGWEVKGRRSRADWERRRNDEGRAVLGVRDSWLGIMTWAGEGV